MSYEQEVVVEVKQRTKAVLQMDFEVFLALEQLVEPLVQTLVSDAVGVDTDQILQGTAAIPVLGDVKLAGRLAQPRDDENHDHVRPADSLAATWQGLLAELVELQGLP